LIRLVTQFDDPAAGPSVAAPAGASGCCSCCCCCIATAIGVSVFSTIHVRSLRRKALEHAEEEPKPVPSPWPEVLGAFAFAIALLIGIILGFATGGVLLLTIPLVWGLLLYGAYRGAGDRSSLGHAAATVISGLLIALIEFVIWAAALA
jgi:hypothetical protein